MFCVTYTLFEELGLSAKNQGSQLLRISVTSAGLMDLEDKADLS